MLDILFVSRVVFVCLYFWFREGFFVEITLSIHLFMFFSDYLDTDFLGLFVCLRFCAAGEQTQGLVHARPVLYH